MLGPRIAVISLLPEMFRALTESGVSARAIQEGLLALRIFNPRDFTEDKHRTVDDRPYGGGPGMVMKVGPLSAALNAAKLWVGDGAKVVYLSPQGQTLKQDSVIALSRCSSLILIAGRYEGIDERFIDTCVHEEWSIGDYVVSGGELPAMVLLDAMIRLLPGALGDEESAEQDSFTDGLLDCPHYTRPQHCEDKAMGSVPEVLMSGDHKSIALWRKQQSLGRTYERRPDLLEKRTLSGAERALLEAYLLERETEHNGRETSTGSEL